MTNLHAELSKPCDCLVDADILNDDRRSVLAEPGFRHDCLPYVDIDKSEDYTGNCVHYVGDGVLKVLGESLSPKHLPLPDRHMHVKLPLF